MLPLDNIGYLLNHLAFVVGRQSDQVLQERFGIGFSQFKILMVLRWEPSIQQKQIADKLGQTEASISRQIKLLHDGSLLQTKIHPENRRRHITTLTPKGERLIDEAMRILNDYHGPMFDTLNEKQRQQLLEALTLMHQYACSGDRAGACHQP